MTKVLFGRDLPLGEGFNGFYHFLFVDVRGSCYGWCLIYEFIYKRLSYLVVSL